MTGKIAFEKRELCHRRHLSESTGVGEEVGVRGELAATKVARLASVVDVGWVTAALFRGGEDESASVDAVESSDL
jgi:hypothetical protein